MRLLDLYCCQGGAAMGYHRAGFTEIVGVDSRPQPRYPFTFVQADAMEYVWNHGRDFDAIHASPPCQRFTRAQRLQKQDHPDLLTPTLEALGCIGVHWVVENVPGSPMPGAVTLCGSSFGLKVRRHRLFLASFPISPVDCRHDLQSDYVTPFGHGFGYVTVFGGGAAKVSKDGRRRANAQQGREAMGIDWMSRDGLSQAIPPAYTEHIGRQMLRFLTEAAA